MAAPESARTTGLYDRRSGEISLDEAERMGLKFIVVAAKAGVKSCISAVLGIELGRTGQWIRRHGQ